MKIHISWSFLVVGWCQLVSQQAVARGANVDGGLAFTTSKGGSCLIGGLMVGYGPGQKLVLQSLLVPSGKRLHNYGKSPCWMGKSTISMASFNSYVTNYQRVDHVGSPFSTVKSPFFPVKAAVTLAFSCIATARGVVRSVRIAGRLLQQMLGAAIGYWMVLGMFFFFFMYDYWRYHLVI